MLPLKIATILDGFSFSGFQYEARLLPLTEGNWRETLTFEKPDLLLVESTWDLANRGLISTCLHEIIKTCNHQQIPTAFWNKEDPFHFDYFIHEPKAFDYIFTTDLDCVPRYQSLLGHNRIFVLPFAAQPKLFNPIGKEQEKLGIIAFAGTWYPHRTEREQDMHELFSPALKYGLHIYDRNYYSRPGLYPEIYRPCIKGWVPYEQLGAIYKKYYLGLNFNTVKHSPTMFARRVFDLLACGIPVTSNYSLGIEKWFAGIVQICNTPNDAQKHLSNLISNKSLRDRIALLGQRKVFAAHTYNHRLKTVLNAIRFPAAMTEPEGISILVCIDDLTQFKNVWENFERQSYPKKEMILMFQNPVNELERWYEKTITGENVMVLEFDRGASREESLNFGAWQAKFDYLTYFDVNNYYGAHFLSDLMNTLKYADAALIGKCAHYVFLPERNSLEIGYPKQEYKYVSQLLASTVIMRRELFRKKNFAKLFQPGASGMYTAEEEIRLYSGDRFNFIRNFSAKLSQTQIREVCF